MTLSLPQGTCCLISTILRAAERLVSPARKRRPYQTFFRHLFTPQKMSDFKLGLCIFHDLTAFSRLDLVEIELPWFTPEFII